MAIPADHIVTVYIPVTVDEVIREAAIEFQKERIQFSSLFILKLIKCLYYCDCFLFRFSDNQNADFIQ